LDDYEALGFSAKEVQRLSEWRKSLGAMEIDLDKLGDYIKKRGSLERQLEELRKEVKKEEMVVKSLKSNHLHLWEQRSSLQEEVSRLSRPSYVLKEGWVILPCWACGIDGVSMKLSGLEATEEAIRKGLRSQGRCIFCGGWSSYIPWDIAWAIARLVLPTTSFPRKPITHANSETAK